MGETILSNANLMGAKNCTREKFRIVGTYEGTIMPDGRSYKEWIRDNGEEEGKEPTINNKETTA